MLGHGDQQGDEAVTRRPQRLRGRLHVTGPMAPLAIAPATAAEEREGTVAGRRVGAPVARLDQERHRVVMRVGQAEVDVEPQAVAQPRQGIRATLEMRRQVHREPFEGLVAERGEDRLLVREVQVDGGGGVFDPGGDAPHRHGVVAVTHEQLARGIEDLLPQRHLGPGPPFAGSHG